MKPSPQEITYLSHTEDAQGSITFGNGQPSLLLQGYLYTSTQVHADIPNMVLTVITVGLVKNNGALHHGSVNNNSDLVLLPVVS